MKTSKIWLLSVFLFFLNAHLSAFACETTARLNLNSSGYDGKIMVELRKGNRPGSSIVSQDVIFTSGQRDFLNVCPGKYFFAFATTDSPTVSITSYFTVDSDTELAEMTVFLSRLKNSSGNKVQTIKRKEL
jgi:hypothetical protein